MELTAVWPSCVPNGSVHCPAEKQNYLSHKTDLTAAKIGRDSKTFY